MYVLVPHHALACAPLRLPTLALFGCVRRVPGRREALAAALLQRGVLGHTARRG